MSRVARSTAPASGHFYMVWMKDVTDTAPLTERALATNCSAC
jgi:hypothetical protein